MIKTVLFDLGGVIINIDRDRSVNAFENLGLKDASSYLDCYKQKGFFLELEDGRLDAGGFCTELSRLCGKTITCEQASQAWLSIITEVPLERLSFLKALRKQYRVCLLSNTNPFIMDWAANPDFCGTGSSLYKFFDHLFLSYRMQCVKPDPVIFEKVLATLNDKPGEILFIDDGPANIKAGQDLGMLTYMPVNGTNWIPDVQKILANSVTNRNRSE
ncbi:MAG TPA: HAD family phosphatase [Bacteroidales bacterium]|nr:HAD family phosphatase [Bacteroidales bacterium]HPJ55507.1 HAD family phosphatase [Bacteroidales bacterium]HPQ56855.1 HAD family phosphatase [Bacteroidales bacterium]